MAVPPPGGETELLLTVCRTPHLPVDVRHGLLDHRAVEPMLVGDR